MPIDMKEVIAEAARKLLFEKKVKKLTVKDIVAESQVTRQTFYYHFEDIPALIKWELEKDMANLLEQARTRENPEEGLKFFFLVAIHVAPYIRQSLQTNYRAEMEKLLEEFMEKLFEQITEIEKLYQTCSYFERNLILRYHSQAVMGILRSWTKEDTENIDEIVHQIYRLITGQINQL